MTAKLCFCQHMLNSQSLKSNCQNYSQCTFASRKNGSTPYTFILCRIERIFLIQQQQSIKCSIKTDTNLTEYLAKNSINQQKMVLYYMKTD